MEFCLFMVYIKRQNSISQKINPTFFCPQQKILNTKVGTRQNANKSAQWFKD